MAVRAILDAGMQNKQISCFQKKKKTFFGSPEQFQKYRL